MGKALVDKYFTWTPTRIEGIGLREIYSEVKRRHLRAYPEREEQPGVLMSGGDYQWRPDGERHLFNPLTIHKLQAAVRTRDGEVWTKGYKTFKEYSRTRQRPGRGICHAARAARTALGRQPDPAGRG